MMRSQASWASSYVVVAVVAAAKLGPPLQCLRCVVVSMLIMELFKHVVSELVLDPFLKGAVAAAAKQGPPPCTVPQVCRGV